MNSNVMILHKINFVKYNRCRQISLQRFIVVQLSLQGEPERFKNSISKMLQPQNVEL